MEENREKNNKKIEDEKRLEQELRQMADDVILPDSLEPEAIQKMLAFLDAESCHEKIQILEEMQDDLTEHILNNIAVSLDLSLEDDEDGFERIMAELRMREKYESNRGDRL